MSQMWRILLFLIVLQLSDHTTTISNTKSSTTSNAASASALSDDTSTSNPNMNGNSRITAMSSSNGAVQNKSDYQYYYYYYAEEEANSAAAMTSSSVQSHTLRGTKVSDGCQILHGTENDNDFCLQVHVNLIHEYVQSASSSTTGTTTSGTNNMDKDGATTAWCPTQITLSNQENESMAHGGKWYLRVEQVSDLGEDDTSPVPTMERPILWTSHSIHEPTESINTVSTATTNDTATTFNNGKEKSTNIVQTHTQKSTLKFSIPPYHHLWKERVLLIHLQKQLHPSSFTTTTSSTTNSSTATNNENLMRKLVTRPSLDDAQIHLQQIQRKMIVLKRDHSYFTMNITQTFQIPVEPCSFSSSSSSTSLSPSSSASSSYFMWWLLLSTGIPLLLIVAYYLYHKHQNASLHHDCEEEQELITEREVMIQTVPTYSISEVGLRNHYQQQHPHQQHHHENQYQSGFSTNPILSTLTPTGMNHRDYNYALSSLNPTMTTRNDYYHNENGPQSSSSSRMIAVPTHHHDRDTFDGTVLPGREEGLKDESSELNVHTLGMMQSLGNDKGTFASEVDVVAAGAQPLLDSSNEQDTQSSSSSRSLQDSSIASRMPQNQSLLSSTTTTTVRPEEMKTPEAQSSIHKDEHRNTQHDVQREPTPPPVLKRTSSLEEQALWYDILNHSNPSPTKNDDKDDGLPFGQHGTPTSSRSVLSGDRDYDRDGCSIDVQLFNSNDDSSSNKPNTSISPDIEDAASLSEDCSTTNHDNDGCHSESTVKRDNSSVKEQKKLDDPKDNEAVVELNSDCTEASSSSRVPQDFISDDGIEGDNSVPPLEKNGVTTSVDIAISASLSSIDDHPSLSSVESKQPLSGHPLSNIDSQNADESNNGAQPHQNQTQSNHIVDNPIVSDHQSTDSTTEKKSPSSVSTPVNKPDPPSSCEPVIDYFSILSPKSTGSRRSTKIKMKKNKAVIRIDTNTTSRRKSIRRSRKRRAAMPDESKKSNDSQSRLDFIPDDSSSVRLEALISRRKQRRLTRKSTFYKSSKGGGENDNSAKKIIDHYSSSKDTKKSAKMSIPNQSSSSSCAKDSDNDSNQNRIDPTILCSIVTKKQLSDVNNHHNRHDPPVLRSATKKRDGNKSSSSFVERLVKASSEPQQSPSDKSDRNDSIKEDENSPTIRDHRIANEGEPNSSNGDDIHHNQLDPPVLRSATKKRIENKSSPSTIEMTAKILSDKPPSNESDKIDPMEEDRNSPTILDQGRSSDNDDNDHNEYDRPVLRSATKKRVGNKSSSSTIRMKAKDSSIQSLSSNESKQYEVIEEDENCPIIQDHHTSISGGNDDDVDNQNQPNRFILRSATKKRLRDKFAPRCNKKSTTKALSSQPLSSSSNESDANEEDENNPAILHRHKKKYRSSDRVSPSSELISAANAIASSPVWKVNSSKSHYSTRNSSSKKKNSVNKKQNDRVKKKVSASSSRIRSRSKFLHRSAKDIPFAISVSRT